MTERQPLPVAETLLECKCCFEKINPADQFCQKCGFPLKGSDEEQRQFFYNRNYQHMEIDSLKKKMESAGTSLYVLAGAFFLYGLVFFFMKSSGDSSSATLITYAVIAVIFLLLGVWAVKRPVASFVSGIVLYGILLLMDVIVDPAGIFKGIIFKIVIISYLIKGLMSAIETEKIRKQHNI